MLYKNSQGKKKKKPTWLYFVIAIQAVLEARAVFQRIRLPTLGKWNVTMCRLGPSLPS